MRVPKAVTRLRNDLARVLWQAHAGGSIVTAPNAIQDAIGIGAAPDEVRGQHRSAWAIAGGIKDHKRRKESVRIERADGAWLHFTVAVTETAEVLAYDFELVFDQLDAPRAARFVRIDLNPVGHPNEVLRGRRCHLHPGHDEIQVPWTEQPPEDVLQLLVNDLPFLDDR